MASPSLFHKSTEVHDKCSKVDLRDSMEKGSKECRYAFIFSNAKFADLRYQATCVPAQMCSANVAGMTEGKIALYGVVLRIIMKTYGKLAYIGQGYQGACTAGMNEVNKGNIDYFYKARPIMWGSTELGKLPPSIEVPGMGKDPNDGLAMLTGFDEVVNPSETDSHSSVDGGHLKKRLVRQEEEEALAEFARQYEACSVREIRQETSDTERQISALSEQIRHLRNKSVYLAKLLEDKVITATVTTVSGERRELTARLGEMVADVKARAEELGLFGQAPGCYLVPDTPFRGRGFRVVSGVKFCYEGEEMADDKSMAHYNLDDGAVVTVLVNEQPLTGRHLKCKNRDFLAGMLVTAGTGDIPWTSPKVATSPTSDSHIEYFITAVGVFDAFEPCPPDPYKGYLYIFDNRAWDKNASITNATQLVKEVEKLRKEKDAKEKAKKQLEALQRTLGEGAGEGAVLRKLQADIVL
ncbi:hypothetical protein AK812_SmicGene41962 [Symbiodinium microadriaticum]|uniref:Ubiquitin-like domain-containing protein n=1 Tax=Symbiodinium microadriaticum TaxID=2951 RepID=A0A1Q9C4S0_SYMMI|nr:hypothetical protein AK812_SmicGene41962 [Symbiodinium microadriaticum]